MPTTSAMATGSTSTNRFRLSVGIPVLAAALGAWYASAFLLQTSSPMMANPGEMVIPIATMSSMFTSPNVGVILSFLVLWVVGMAAMMFPAMIPVISIYTNLMAKGEGKSRFYAVVGSSLFLGGYLSLYALLGLGLFALVYAAFQLGSVLAWASSLSVAALASVLLFAGIWQVTPLKEKSLSNCISPMGFFVTHAKQGLTGAVRMGAEHGAYCVACCWLYMLVMLAVAAMSLPSMILLSGLIIIEKAFVGKAVWFKGLSAGIFISLALIVVFFPSYLSII